MANVRVSYADLNVQKRVRISYASLNVAGVSPKVRIGYATLDVVPPTPLYKLVGSTWTASPTYIAAGGVWT